MGKYSPVESFLVDRASPVVVAIGLIDQWVDGLPTAARDASWWSNDAGRPQSGAWLNAGWRVQAVDLVEGRVTFVRVAEHGSSAEPEAASPLSHSFRHDGWRRLTVAGAFIVGLGTWYGVVRDVLGDAIATGTLLSRPFGIQWPDVVLWCLLLAFVGGGLWAVALREYRVFGGSVETEPHGSTAVAWGAVTFTPIAATVGAVGVYVGLVDVAQGLVVAICSTLSYAAAARLFYGGRTPPGQGGWRRAVEARVDGRIVQELLISSVWSVLLAIGALVPTALLLPAPSRPDPQDLLNLPLVVALAVLPTVAVCVTAVALTREAAISDPLRGPLAAIALRTGIALGLAVVIGTAAR